MTPSLRFLKKGVLRKLEVSHGKKLGLGTFLNSHSIFSEWSPGKTSKITFDCLFTKPMPSALQWCMISIFWKKRFWENWRWAMARSWGWAFFKIQIHISQKEARKKIFDWLFAKPLLRTVRWCLMSVFWNKRFWEYCRRAKSKIYGSATGIGKSYN